MSRHLVLFAVPGGVSSAAPLSGLTQLAAWTHGNVNKIRYLCCLGVGGAFEKTDYFVYNTLD
jgi:hypothetical protein